MSECGCKILDGYLKCIEDLDNVFDDSEDEADGDDEQ